MKFNLHSIYNITALLGLALFIISCSEQRRTIIKNYQPNKAFAYKNTITVNGNLTKDEKKQLIGNLANYWDDSLQVKKLQSFLVLYKVKNPPLFDTANIYRSQKNMSNYLNSLGYYYSEFDFPSIHFDTINAPHGYNLLIFPKNRLRDQIRTTLSMNIRLGKNITVDSVNYVMADSSLQRIAKNAFKNAYTLPGKPYTKQGISSDLDRLAKLYRDSGYYKINRTDFYALVDSTNRKLLKLTFDQHEQAKLLMEATKSKKENPQWDVTFYQKDIDDSLKIRRYYINKTYFYPETKATEITDSLMLSDRFYETGKKDLILRYKEGKFRLRPMRDNIYLRKDSLYNESKVYRSINNLSRIGAWQQVDLKIKDLGNDSLDLYYFLTPNIKQNYEVTIEGSQNTGDIASSNLLGISTTIAYRNRNVWKQATQSTTSLRGGIELNTWNSRNTTNDLLQTIQAGIAHTYSFPRLIQPFKNWDYLKTFDNKKTNISFAASYTDRKQYYVIRNLNASLGYEWLKGPYAWSFKPLNIELYGLDTLPKFDSLIHSNPFLKNSFRDGNVFGLILGVARTFISKRNPNINHYLRLGFEESGTITSLLIKSDRLFEYQKLEGEYRFHHKYKKTDFGARYFMGVVFPRKDQHTPVYKQFFMGGPNSMRAWGLRQLGLGSSILSDTSTTGYTDRFGDFAIEANVEYRFNLLEFSSFKLASAIFADAGNIWSLKNNPTDPNAQFRLNKLYQDIALGVGTGIRVDFSYVLIRLDVGYKVKDPARQDANGLINNGWMSFPIKLKEQRMNGVSVNNYTFQLGINLPF